MIERVTPTSAELQSKEMAKKRINTERNKRWMSLISDDSIEVPQEEVQAPLSDGRMLRGNTGSESGSMGTMGYGIDSRPTLLTQNNTGVTQSPANITQPTNITVKNPMPLLTSNNVDHNRLTGQLLDTSQDEPYNVGLTEQPIVVSGTSNNKLGAARMTPEEEYLSVLANTNPQPRSTWKRILSGVMQGAAQVNPNMDTLGSALGKIAGGTVRAIPSVDSGYQYQQNVREATQNYNVQTRQRAAEQQVQEQQLRQKKLDADIKQAQDKLEADAKEKKLLNDARLRGEQRQQASQLLKSLENTPTEDKATRQELVKQLRQLGVPASTEYGKDKQKSAQKQQTIYDEESGNYIRADEKGNPILNNGKPIVVRPAKDTQANATQNRAEAESQEPAVMQGALRNQAMNEARAQFPKAAKMNDAQLLADDTIGAWVRARTSDLTAEAAAQRKSNVNKRLSNSKATTGKSNSKIKPSNAASPTNFDARNYLR